MADKQPEALAKIAKAMAIVAQLCDGATKWTMSVPARPDSDPDLVLSDALNESAALLRTQHKQIAAYELLTKSQEAQLSHHREQSDKYREAIATLQSERDANALLTAAIERKDALLRRALGALREYAEYDHCVLLSDAITKELQ